AWAGDVVEHHVCDHEVGVSVREGQVLEPAEAEIDVREALRPCVLARDLEHLRGGVDADHLLGARAQIAKEDARAGAEVDDGLGLGNASDERRDVPWGAEHLVAAVVPAASHAAEEGLGPLPAPLERGLDRLPLRVDARPEVGGELAEDRVPVLAAPAGRELVIDPRALAARPDEPGIEEDLEVSRDAALAQPEHEGELIDVEGPFPENGQKPQPGLVAERSQGAEERVHAEQDIEKSRYLKPRICPVFGHLAGSGKPRPQEACLERHPAVSATWHSLCIPLGAPVPESPGGKDPNGRPRALARSAV